MQTCIGRCTEYNKQKQERPWPIFELEIWKIKTSNNEEIKLKKKWMSWRKIMQLVLYSTSYVK